MLMNAKQSNNLSWYKEDIKGQGLNADRGVAFRRLLVNQVATVGESYGTATELFERAHKLPVCT